MLVLYLVVMLSYSVLLTVVGVTNVLINILLARYISKQRVNISRSATANAGKKYATGVSGIEMIETIKSSGAENSFFERWAGYQALMNKDQVRTERLNQYLGSLPATLTSLANVAVLVLGIWLIVRGEFTPGMLLAFTGFLSSFTAPVNQLTALGQTVQEMETQMERIEDVMNYESDVPEECGDPTDISNLKQEFGRGKLRGQVDMEGVSFGAMVGRLNTGDVVALIPKGLGGYWYINPSTDEKVRVSAEVARHLDQETTFFYKPLPSRSLKKGDLGSFVFSSLSRSDYLVVLGAATVMTLVGLLPAWANKVAFGVVAPSGQMELVLPIAALLVGVTITTTLFGICRNLIMARVSIKLSIASESATYARVLSLPASFFKEYAAGELANRMGSLTALCQLMVSILLGSGLSALLSLVYVFQIFAYAPALGFQRLSLSSFRRFLASCPPCLP